MAWIPFAAAAASAAGDVVGGLIGSHGQEETNAANAALAQRQMDFQERMSSTAYQRATADMRAAGLNPLLAYQQGGASSPQGTMATMQNPAAALGSGVSEGVSSAMSALQLQKQLGLLEAQTEKTKQDANLSYTQAQLNQLERVTPPGAGSSWWEMQREAAINMARSNAASAGSMARLNQAGLPAAQVMGSKKAAYLRIMLGNMGVIPGAAGAAMAAGKAVQ